MKILVSGATATVRRYAAHVGRFLGPRNGNSVTEIVASGQVWAADNDAFAAWDQERFWVMLSKIAKADRSRFLWVACPDVVGDSRATLDNWDVWFPQIDYLGLPAAFVGQDGCEDTAIPWDQMACFFIGGSDKFKLSAEAEQLASEAKARGKLVHMGRVNSYKRARHAYEIGCDSIDGRSFSAWPDIYIPKGIDWCRRLAEQPWLFGRHVG